MANNDKDQKSLSYQELIDKAAERGPVYPVSWKTIQMRSPWQEVAEMVPKFQKRQLLDRF